MEYLTFTEISSNNAIIQFLHNGSVPNVLCVTHQYKPLADFGSINQLKGIGLKHGDEHDGYLPNLLENFNNRDYDIGIILEKDKDVILQSYNFILTTLNSN